MDINRIRVNALKAVMAGASQKDFANQHGLDASYLSQILNGHRNLGEKAAANLEEKIGLPKGSLVSPGAPDTQTTLAAGSAAEQLRLALSKVKGLSENVRGRLLGVAEAGEGGDRFEPDYYRPGAVGDEVWIAHYDVRAAMGGGQIPQDHPEILQDVRISPRHLREMGVEFREHYHLKIVTGWGQSMAPTIKHRDPLLVDISIREFVGDGIYMFSWEGHLYIKRLQWIGDGQLSMISDNALHPPRTIPAEETYIQARVLLVWNAHLV